MINTNLVGIKGLNDTQIQDFLRPSYHVPTAGSTVALLFLEPSTRTFASFHQAIVQLGLVPLVINQGSSSMEKGESVLDTCRNLEWIGVSAIIIRTSENGLPERLSVELNIPVINAGDGINEHPTQALGDTLTLMSHFGVRLRSNLRDTLKEKRVGFYGDVRNSRVATSVSHLFTRLGASVSLPGCPTLTDHLNDVDVVYALRFQKERSGEPPREYRPLDRFLLEHAKDDAVVMHAGPVLPDDIDLDIAFGPQSLVEHQVRYGVAARMNVLRRLLR